MSDSKPSFREELIRENSRFLGNFLDQHGFIALCLAFIFALALLDKLSSIRNTSTPIAPEFGSAVDTNSWFLVNQRGYYVKVRTNVWPVMAMRPEPISPSGTSNRFVVEGDRNQFPAELYYNGVKISPLLTNTLWTYTVKGPRGFLYLRDF